MKDIYVDFYRCQGKLVIIPTIVLDWCYDFAFAVSFSWLFWQIDIVIERKKEKGEG